MSAQELCQACEATIAAAQRSVAEGAIVDLSGLDLEVEQVCATLILLPSEERAATADQLQRLSMALDRLAEAVKAQQAGLYDGEERATPGRAAQAYDQTRNEIG